MLKRTTSSYFPSLGSNAVVQLILALGVAFVGLGLVQNIMRIVHYTDDQFKEIVLTNVAIGPIYSFPGHFWTIVTFGLFHLDFWALVSNMIWLYCFGNLVQMLIGYKQIVPIFLYGIITGGIFYLLCQLIPLNVFFTTSLVTGPQAGIIALAAAALTLSPQYRFYFTPTFSVPLYVIFCIFAFFIILNTGLRLPLLLQIAGGGLMGWGYVKLLRNGYKPGDWIYDVFSSVERTVTPNEHIAWARNTKKRSNVLRNMPRKDGLSQTKIDDILDKINQRGYNSLSAEEKALLMQASKENK